MASFPIALPSKESHFMTLSQEGPLFILHLHHKDNRFTTDFCQAILKALQIVEDRFLSAEEPTDMALVTLGNDKIFSNGLDLMHAITYSPFMDVYLTLLRRYLTFCIPTVAAINGYVPHNSLCTLKKKCILNLMIDMLLLVAVCWHWLMVTL